MAGYSCYLLQKSVLVCKNRDLESQNRHLEERKKELTDANQQLRERQAVWAHTTPSPYSHVAAFTSSCHRFVL